MDDVLSSPYWSPSSAVPPAPITPQPGALQAVLILLVFFVTFLACMLAFAVRRAASHDPTFGSGFSSRLFSLLSVFGGGVFLSTCLLDLLPDALADIRRAEKLLSYKPTFPIAELFVAIGFLFVLIVEQVTVFAREQNWINSNVLERLISREEILPDSTVNPHAYHEQLPEEESSEADFDVHFNPSMHSTIRAALLVVALSLHAVFEGLSLGIIGDVNVLLQIFGALLVHKSLIGFSLGLRLVQSRMRVFTIIVCCLIFSVQVLVGGFGGIALLRVISAGNPGRAAVLSGCAQAVACGTFLYITCFEILPHELSQRGLRPLKLLCLILGFLLISVMIAIFPEEGDDD